MKRSLLIVFILMTMILVCGCIVSNQSRVTSNSSNNTISNNNSLPSNKFVAMAIIVRNSGTIVSGQMPYIAGAHRRLVFSILCLRNIIHRAIHQIIHQRMI